VANDPAAIQVYAQRCQTVSEHLHLLRLHLGFRPLGPAEHEALCHFLLEDALRLEHTPALVARAEEFLRDRRIPLPAGSTVRRFVGEQPEQARHRVYTRLMALMPAEMPARLDALLQVEEPQRSTLQALKAPPGMPSPRALLQSTDKLEQMQAAQLLTLDLSWLNSNLQKAFAQQAWQASAHRLRSLPAPHRYTVLVCFLSQTYSDTLDQLVDM
jgi:hypothetical protein